MLIDEEKDFSKWNCKWIKKLRGRAVNPKTEEKKVKKKVSISNRKTICLSLEADHLDFIKSQALQMSVSQGVYIEPNTLIREALQRAFPTPKQFDMFGGRR